MVRSFSGEAVDPAWLSMTCAEALRAPTAGNSAGVRCHVVEKPHVAAYFAHATDEAWRQRARRAPGLLRAGAVVLMTARPEDYLERYGEPDKASSGLSNLDAWPLPYWHADAAMATMALLLLVEEAGLGATIWGNFRHDEAVRQWAHLGDEQLFCAVLIGHPDGHDVPSASLSRPVPARADRVVRVEP
jgi:nitroreductase